MFLLLFLSFAHVPSSVILFARNPWACWFFLCFRQDALVSVAGKWIKSTTTGLESASLRGRWVCSSWWYDSSSMIHSSINLWTGLLGLMHISGYKFRHYQKITKIPYWMLLVEYCTPWKSSLFSCMYNLNALFTFVIFSDGIWAPESSQWPKSYHACFFCDVWLEMGRCCVCTDTTVEEPNPMADWLGSWTAGCLLAESCHPIFLSQYPQVSDICRSLCIGVFLHDTYRICAITCQSWGSWKGCSISEASNRSVRFLSLYIVSLACCQRLRWSISCFFSHGFLVWFAEMW